MLGKKGEGMDSIVVGRFTVLHFRQNQAGESFGVRMVGASLKRDFYDKKLCRLAELAHFRKIAEKMQRRTRTVFRFQKCQRVAYRCRAVDDLAQGFGVFVGNLGRRFVCRHLVRSGS